MLDGSSPVKPFPSQYVTSRFGKASKKPEGNVPDIAQKLQLNCTTFSSFTEAGQLCAEHTQYIS